MSNSQGDKKFQMHHCRDKDMIKCLAIGREGWGGEWALRGNPTALLFQ